MPLVERSSYKHPFWLSNPHIQTVYPTLRRKLPDVPYQREALTLSDGDFLDLDWLQHPDNNRLVVMAHGLEGNTHRIYMRGMARFFFKAGWDVLAWNCRGCGGRPNRLLKYYHSGCSEDLAEVVGRALDEPRYSAIALMGFSMGGNITLKYIGEQAEGIDPRIVGGVTFSVPCDLTSSSYELSKPHNYFYLHRFLKMLHQKVRLKMPLFPGQIDDLGYNKIKSFKDFDDRYTAPLHGFRDAEDYWTKSSCKPYIPRIRVPVLLVTAQDDPFLPPACYPVDEAAGSDFFYLETPEKGGHTGFVSKNDIGVYWSEQRALSFLETLVREKLIAGIAVD